MKIARVVGTVVSTVKHPSYHGLKLYVVQPVDEHGRDFDQTFLAVDMVQSGVGDLVLVINEGNGARQIFNKPILPIRSVIVGVVDEIDIEENVGSTSGAAP
ncbi:MAG: EutN/CcmL family microcompartment protein [Deltaproteobacteria bacterium]|nr:EutN/CcmL family microcompartment protein [Deltaproteobacteria bacterium]